MSYLNYEFFDEFKALDNLCRDIYGGSVDNKLGVTLYLEDMDKKAHRGTINVSGWVSDYNRLKSARNIRNELAHSRNSMTVDICSQEDIDFVRSFSAKILNQTDPLAMLRKQSAQHRFSTAPQPKRQPQPIYTTPATAFETVYFWPDLPQCFCDVGRVLKSGGTILICNESNGDTDRDEKWTEIIGGLTIYKDTELKAFSLCPSSEGYIALS